VETRPGLFEVADGGSLFVDEVGEMSPALQAKLLRVLDLGEFHRVGDPRGRRANVRVLSATNRDLRDAVERGAFREDLYYRLNVVTIRVPALRDRREDIPLLLAHFLKRQRGGRGEEWRFGPDALALLAAYAWPGNVRELANVVERAVLLARGPVIAAREVRRLLEGPLAPQAQPPRTGPTLSELERDRIAAVLAREGGNRARTARALGISLRNLYRKLKRHGLAASSPGRDPSPPEP
jgi:DNA-binding NtrC family response regulator